MRVSHVGSMATLGVLLAAAAFAADRQRESLNDLDVRGIQVVVADVWPGEIVSIDGFRDGCACQEGPACTAEASILVVRDGESKRIGMSKVDGRWGIAKRQSWLWRGEQMDARPKTDLKRRLAEIRQWLAEEPACIEPPRPKSETPRCDAQ